MCKMDGVSNAECVSVCACVRVCVCVCVCVCVIQAMRCYAHALQLMVVRHHALCVLIQLGSQFIVNGQSELLPSVSTSDGEPRRVHLAS